jgi:hypothetical protein
MYTYIPADHHEAIHKTHTTGRVFRYVSIVWVKPGRKPNNQTVLMYQVARRESGTVNRSAATRNSMYTR